MALASCQFENHTFLHNHVPHDCTFMHGQHKHHDHDNVIYCVCVCIHVVYMYDVHICISVS